MKRWQEHFAAVLNCPEPDVGLLHEFENDTEDIPALEVNMEESEKWWYQKENGLEETRRHNQRTKTKMFGTCHTNGGLQNTSPGYTVGVERIQEEARTTKDKLDGHRETQPEKHGCQLVRSQGTSGWQERMASRCGPMLPTWRGMNRTEQNNKVVFFILYFENTSWSILLFAKYFLKLLFENTLHNDEGWGHIVSVQFLPVLSITYFIISQIQKFFEV